jgi:hypothetical protein
VFDSRTTLDLSSQVAILRQSVAMLSPGERAISREQAFVILGCATPPQRYCDLIRLFQVVLLLPRAIDLPSGWVHGGPCSSS